jgi:hypothetical protein
VKFFNTPSFTKKQLRATICSFAYSLNVHKVIFNDKGKSVNGSYNGITKVLYLNMKQTKISLLRTFFHELGHHLAVQKNKWSSYHLNTAKMMNVETVFNIENKIDQMGEELWYKYVDIKKWGRYKYVYPKTNKNYFIKNFTSK